MYKSYVEMLKSTKSTKEPPSIMLEPQCISNVGKKWTEAEENVLLEELNKNIDIEIISRNHKRKIGGIQSRCKEIAYKMHLNHSSIEEIMQKTRLDYGTVKKIIHVKQHYKKIKPVLLECDIVEIKNDIKDLKKSILELTDMMKAVYEFEHS
jgi:hypothetical protein